MGAQIVDCVQGFARVVAEGCAAIPLPHKFGHGHAVYALIMAKDVAALKAVSQNLMHENLTVTDGVYGILSDADVSRQISALGHGAGLEEDGNLHELVEQTRKLLGRLEDASHRG